MTGSNLQWILSAVQEFDISVSRAMELIECDRAGTFTKTFHNHDSLRERLRGVVRKFIKVQL